MKTKSGEENIYRADYEYREDLGRSVIGCHAWKPSIFMPRSASRITLEITGVKVERLQDISEEDALAEGAMGIWFKPGTGCRAEAFDTARAAFRHLWSSCYEPGLWEANPWVWVISFRTIEA